jgi:ATP-dependent DNA helicase RecG
MKPSLQKLQKFFNLEAERGYDNHAVMGGLDRILDHWEGEARADELPEDLIQMVAARLHDYPRLTPTSRAEVLDGLWRRIQRGTETASLLIPAQEAPPPEKAAASQEIFSPKDTLLLENQQEPAEIVQEEDQPAPIEREKPVLAEAPPVPASARPVPVPGGPAAALNAPITVLPGVGPRHAQTLSRLGLVTLRDMLYYFPRRYDDYSKLKPINRLWFGEEVTVIGTVQSISSRPLRGSSSYLVEAVVSDGTGALRVTWFNQVWVAKRLRSGAHIVLSGKIDQYLGRLVMNSPEWEPLEQEQLSTNRIVPVYPLTAQITQRWLRRLMNQVITYWAPRVQDPLPAALRRSAGLVDISQALIQVHFPDSWDSLKAAQQRLAFDEIFLLQMGVLRQKRAWQDRTARKFETDEDWFQSQVERLPFPLTGAQQRALQDVRHDLASGRPMNRLLQGDVGSGKTVIAALAISMVTRTGAQAALMAPTSILAEQHYRNLLKMLAGDLVKAQPVEELELVIGDEEKSVALEGAALTDVIPSIGPEQALSETKDQDSSVAPLPQNDNSNQENQVDGDTSQPVSTPPLQESEIRLMIGATSESEKREVRAGLADGTIKVVIGTHALIEDPVIFNDMQLTIVDEQHRFGVEQRAALRSKGANPHLLVMTATPIPRSLALTVYGDLDLSVMDEMPPGRQPVGTYVLPPRELERAFTLIRGQVEQGHQAFVIYPLVEESDKSDAKAAVEEHSRLQKEIFPKLKLGLLHGRMRPEEKDEVMSRFRDGGFQILVSTSVVEVGVDVPNATVMLIEGANRFGLAQLHQFRGRVGRGPDKAYCLLIPDTPDALENQRLQVMAETNDGFVLAEKDLEQRGPGQFLGTRQSGYSELQLASLTDVRLIEKARRHAQDLFEQDPNLTLPEHRPLNEAVDRFWGGGTGDIS